MALDRRAFLKGLAATVAAGAALPGLAEAATRAGEDPPLQGERRTFTVAGLHPAHDGLRVAQLSDLHVGPRTPPERIRAAIEAANAFRPDLVVLTGDYVCNQRREAGEVREALAGLEAPTVAVLGNHDYWTDPRAVARSLVRLGYDVLENENTTLTLRGEPFTVVGVGDLFTGNARPFAALRGARRGGSRIVLAHGPKTADLLKLSGEPLLCLSGHTHGGQINIPGVTRVLLSALAHEPYDRGLFHVGPVQLYVNRGVGNAAVRVRVNAAPEVTLATLRAA
ncbi:metallophosphoesterase [Anaeromyxobacter paludicola]|uniref:Calcineurin-like phosphoesterase domain-containing protein n=1 Tax=Anaeromyxobacter paludicola TaxID=2918171 RepID=A0ABM7X561_9BACT|nr:metallophosphoesterase [Anaeromyxobacter paludicola]BDG06953.1 hypothetical protein AMPC_00660 [Anaeromyxobacter paludicola]